MCRGDWLIMQYEAAARPGGLQGAMAKYFCQVAGIEPINSGDGSANWWMFANEPGEIYEGLLARFPASPPHPSENAA